MACDSCLYCNKKVTRKTTPNRMLRILGYCCYACFRDDTLDMAEMFGSDGFDADEAAFNAELLAEEKAAGRL